MEHRVFGAPQPGVEYRDRPGAYGIAFDGAGKAAVVSCERKGCFLLGGGIEPGESEAECIRREFMEEIGYSVTVGEKVCVGEEYSFTRREQIPFHFIGHIYLVELREKLAQGEPDRGLVWLPVEERREKMAMDYQAWAVETAWEHYQNSKKEKKS